MSVLRLWFLATGSLIVLGLIWVFAPILIPIFVITAGLGVIVAGIVALARRLEKARGSRRNDTEI
jgi:hypothetical protein